MLVILRTYLRQDAGRLFGLFTFAVILLLTAYLTLHGDPTGLKNVIWILAAISIAFILHSAFLKGRAYPENDRYILARLWKHNLAGQKSVTWALALLLLMQFQFISFCFLVLVWFSCLFFNFEFVENEGICTFLDALYVILISATTIGFGDIPPLTSGGRVLALLSSFIGMILLGLVVASAWHSIQATFVIFRQDNGS